MNSVKLTQYEIDKILELGKAGKKQKDIAKWFAIGQARVSRILIENGVRRNFTQRSYCEKTHH